MSAFFTDHFRAALFANGNLMENVNVRLCFFRSAPSLEAIDATWRAADTKDELLATNGWSEVNGIGGYPLTNTLNVATRAVPIEGSAPVRNNRYVIFSEYPFDQLTDPAPVEAIGIEFIGTINGVVNPLIMVSTTPVGAGTNLYPRDALTANPDTNLGAQSNRYLFAWAEPPTGATQVDLIEGPLSIFKGAPDFEASNTVHLWLYPSRANMIANPSFEAIGTGYWASSGTIERVADPALGGGGFAGKFSGAAPVIVESNVWETRLGNLGSEYWTMQLMAKGDGQCKVGLISWDADYRSTQSDWGDGETWELVPDAWIHIATVRRAPDAATVMMRIEVDGTEVTIDRVLAERGALKDWPYFDGDSTFALQDSYSWYGGYGRRGATYSMWYDMRRSVMGRLFATPVDTTYPGDVLSDAEVAEAGLVYQWVPAGVSVIPHIDVFYPGDTRPPPPLKSAAIQPYYDADTQRMGVLNPWV